MRSKTIAEVARMGAHALNKKLSPGQRKLNAKRAAKARWANHNALKRKAYGR
jgi:hypothetical protein